MADANEDRALSAEERLALILEATQAGTWEWDLPDGLIALNERAAEMLGYRLCELSRVSQADWWGLVHPDDTGAAWQQLQEHLAGQRSHYNVERRLKHRDGSWVWVNTRGKVFRWSGEGQPLRMAGTHIDITERKAVDQLLALQQERLELALEASGDSVWDWDAVTGEVHVTPRHYEMLGYEPGCFESSSAAWAALVHPDDRVTSYAWSDDAVSVGTYQMEARRRAADGGWKWVLTRGKVVGRSAGGQVLRVIGVDTDITERKRVDESLRDAIRVAEELSASRAEFLAMCSHELKTPLTVLLASCQLFQRSVDGLDKQSSARLLGSMGRQAKRLDRLVRDLLDVSRIETGHLSLELVPTHLDRLVRRIVRDFANACPTHRVMAVDLSECTADVDRVRLEQMLVNLLSNAAKYSAGGTAITVSIACDSDLAHISVADEGCGIPEDAIAKLFERYYRHPSTGGVSGLGMGLYVTSELCRLHGGTIGVKTQVGKGSSFTLTLPLAHGEPCL